MRECARVIMCESTKQQFTRLMELLPEENGVSRMVIGRLGYFHIMGYDKNIILSDLAYTCKQPLSRKAKTLVSAMIMNFMLDEAYCEYVEALEELLDILDAREYVPTIPMDFNPYQE